VAGGSVAVAAAAATGGDLLVLAVNLVTVVDGVVATADAAGGDRPVVPVAGVGAGAVHPLACVPKLKILRSSV
jgi:hypothetical protein